MFVFELAVHDGEWSSDPDEVVTTIQNINAPPACALARADNDWLWPPNHRLVAVQIVGIADPNDDDVTVAVIGVTQDEPTDGVGDGDTNPDAVIQDGGSLLIRAERDGDGNGRVYRIHFQAVDDFGEQCYGTVTVNVPHDRRDVGCVDDGQLFDSEQ